MKKKRRGNRAGTLIVVFICVALVFAALWGIVTGIAKLMHYGENTTIQHEQEQTEEEKLSKETETVPMEETVDEVLPKNIYNSDGFYEIDGIRYYHGGDFEGIPGVDVSSWQENIDWEAVKDAGIEFAMVRVGYRGYAEGKLDLDDCFQKHIEGAIAAGMDVGVYFFSQALTPEEAKEEAEYVLEQIAGYELQYPVVFDWEEIITNDNSEQNVVPRTDEMNMLMLTSCALSFCETVEEAGYRAGIYFNQAYGYEQLNLVSLKDYVFWLAEYDPTPSFAYDFQIWQYTNEGTVPGIDGPVDLNISFHRRSE